MGRIIEGYFTTSGESYLTPARVRDRGFNFVKIDNDKFTFLIERHPYACKNGYVSKIITEKWVIDIPNGVAFLESST